MATYAIGDVQGCFDELEQLLKELSFDAGDELWFVGDLVNRGPKSLEVLRFARDLGERATVVLGNHDLHLVAQHAGCERARKDDTFADVLGAPDCDELVGWLRTRPMMHVAGDYAMVHAGLLPQWSIGKALSLGKEVEATLAGPGCKDFLEHMYGSRPERWDDALTSWDRLRVIVNAMTRMRFCTRDGKMEFHAKGAAPPPGYFAWFDTRPADETQTIVCGHWSQLGLKLAPRLAAIDSGCVWGGALTALKLEDRSLHAVRCGSYQAPGAET